jgi:hypothetical protein
MAKRNSDTYLTDLIILSPEIGVNNQNPVEPVYRSFEIERKLKKANVIKDNLSEKTISTLAQLIASQQRYSISHERYMKYMMSSLESILRADPSVDTTLLHAFTLFIAW